MKERKPILSNPSGMQWYHIVEQHADNIKKFGAKKIHSLENMVLIPGGVTGSLHGKVSWYYTSSQRINGIFYSHFRDYVKYLDFNRQYNEGIRVLKLFGGDIYIK